MLPTNDTGQTSDAGEFIALLVGRMNKATKSANRNYIAAYSCNIVAVAASAVAAVLAALDTIPHHVLALITATPGAALVAFSVFAFDKKADWTWQKIRKYDGFLMAVKFENYPVLDASRELRAYEARNGEGAAQALPIGLSRLPIKDPGFSHAVSRNPSTFSARAQSTITLSESLTRFAPFQGLRFSFSAFV